MPSILIAGAGQLGSRYLQGLARVHADLTVVVSDPSPDSLRRAEARWREADGDETTTSVTFTESLDDLPRQLDVAIVATTADVRPAVVDRIAAASPRYWVLEKVLGQSEAAIDAIEAATRGAEGAWVNTPRRSMEWHRELREVVVDERRGAPMTVEVTGGAWGLASNAVHFLDLVQWWAGSPLRHVDTSALDPSWFEGKRPGYQEVFGSLVAGFGDGTRARLSAGSEAATLRIVVADGTSRWMVDEATGTACADDGRLLRGRIPYQSELTAGLVESLLVAGRCALPTLAESAVLHRIFLKAMLDHWNQHMTRRTTLPIT